MALVILFIFSLTIGYYFSNLVSDPGKKKHKLPQIKIKNLEIMPNVRLHIRSKTFHIHHWVYWSVAAVLIVHFYDGVQQALFQGATLGGVIQGLRYPDRFKIRYPRQVSSN